MTIQKLYENSTKKSSIVEEILVYKEIANKTLLEILEGEFIEIFKGKVFGMFEIKEYLLWILRPDIWIKVSTSYFKETKVNLAIKELKKLKNSI